MVRGAEYKFSIILRNSETGLPITDPLVLSDIELALRTSATKTTIMEYSLDNGIENVAEGEYVITIPAEHTLLLPAGATAFLEGFVRPVNKSLKVRFGTVYDNQKNYPLQNG